MISISKVSGPEQLMNSSTKEGKSPNKLVVALETVILVSRVPRVAHTDPGVVNQNACRAAPTARPGLCPPSLPTSQAHAPCVELPAPCEAPPRDELPSGM